MSIKLMSLVWDLDLPAGDKLVLLALADQANDEGVQCWPSIATIARRSGQGERTVRRCISDLEGKGHLTRHFRDGDSTQYHIHPGHNGTPAKSAPLPKTTLTPAKLAAKTPRTTKLPSGDKSPSGKRAKDFPAPDGVSAEQWSGFVQHRRDHKKGGPLNQRAYTILCNKLRAFADHGWPPGDMIDRAIDHGWITVFEPTGQDNGKPRFQQSSGASTDRTIAAAIEVFGHPDDPAYQATRGHA
jgi:hypothetical protein